MKKLVALVLLAGIIPACNNAEKTKSKKDSGTIHTYEPKFKKEGELAFLNSDKDSIGINIDIELAITDEEQSYGMMYRKSVPENTGMLFLRKREERQSFWMRNTYVPLDIIYIRADSSIVSVVENAVPLNDMSLPSDGPALFVLEVAGGFCAEKGIMAGYHIRFRPTSE
jgi:uncharacterized membrane protein (UPF0127 family)